MELLKPLIALLALVNPIGVLPFYIHFTRSFSRAQRAHTIRVSAFTVFSVIAVSALAGLGVLGFFGISIASFQVGGGMLLLISSLQMLNAQPADSRPSDATEGAEKADAGASIAVVPLAIPLLTGPGVISTVVIYAERASRWWELAIMVAYGAVIAVVTYLVFSAASRIAKIVGRTGINVMTRLMGLILSAIAVEIMANGLTQLFPVLASRLGG